MCHTLLNEYPSSRSNQTRGQYVNGIMLKKYSSGKTFFKEHIVSVTEKLKVFI